MALKARVFGVISADIHCAMAIQLVQILVKNGMGVDEGYIIVYNK